MDSKNEILIYEDKDGITKVNVTFTDEDIWLTQSQLADIYKTSREKITMHILNIYKDNELPKDSTCKKFLQVQNEGSRRIKRNIGHYNLDMIIALGYRVQSEVAVRFRIWATQRLNEYIQKGFASAHINWLITIYLTFLEFPLFTRLCDNQDLACLIEKYVKIDKNQSKMTIFNKKYCRN